MRVKFEEVKLSASRSGQCIFCGNKCSIKRTFMQTLNPFNKGKDGRTKTRSQIIVELNAEIKAWQQKPIAHSKCEDSDRAFKRIQSQFINEINEAKTNGKIN